MKTASTIWQRLNNQDTREKEKEITNDTFSVMFSGKGIFINYGQNTKQAIKYDSTTSISFCVQ